MGDVLVHWCPYNLNHRTWTTKTMKTTTDEDDKDDDEEDEDDEDDEEALTNVIKRRSMSEECGGSSTVHNIKRFTVHGVVANLNGHR